jgi:hydroxymethylbilane synthase
VHSLKDLPTETVPGLALVAVPERDDPFDALISRDDRRLRELASGATIGTGSLRRQAQLLHARPDLTMQSIRGNVDTRLRKLRGGDYDAIVLAVAGLRRLALESEITERLVAEIMLPAIGQGALGIEARADDARTVAALRAIDDATSHRSVAAERSLLATLRGGCLAPIGAWGRIESDEQLHLSAVVLSADGRHRLAADGSSNPDAAVELGQRVAADLRSRGADALIGQTRGGR